MGRASGLIDLNAATPIAAEICRVKRYDRTGLGDPSTPGASPTEHPALFARSVEWRVGAVPGQARLQLDTLEQIDTEPRLALRTIGGAAQLHRVGGRVSLTLARSGLPLFHGTIVHLETDLAADRLEFTALDDRWLLAGVPVYGCIVADPTTGDLTYAQGWPLIFNPDGLKNCRDVNGIPVFTHTAEWNAAPATGETPGPGEALTQARHWTVADILQYLRFAYFSADAAPLFNAFPFQVRAAAFADRIQWPPDFHAAVLPGDAAGDSVRATAPEIAATNRTPRHLVLDGLPLTEALERVLTAAGPYTLSLQPVADAQLSQSRLGVVLCDRAARPQDQEDAGIELPRPRNAVAGSVPSAGETPGAALTGGVHHLDIESSFQSTVTMGDRVRLESRFAQTGPTTGDLLPAWTADEETAFKDFLATAADPLEALHAAMRKWPRVGQAYRIAPAATALDAGGIFTALPRVACSRTPDQALLSTDPTSDTLKRVLRMPITIETQELAGGGSPWHAALIADGLTLDSFGTVYLPGLLLSDGNRSNHNSSFGAGLQFRNLRINCAVPLDHAVTFVVAANDGDLPLPGDPAGGSGALVTAGLDGALFPRSPRAQAWLTPGLQRQQAHRTQGTYRHEFRYDAWPVQAAAGGAAQSGLYRSDLNALRRAAQESARDTLEPRIAFAPELAGISPGLAPGQVLRRVVDEGEEAAAMAEATATTPQTEINAMIERVIFDFAPKPMTRVYSR